MLPQRPRKGISLAECENRTKLQRAPATEQLVTGCDPRWSPPFMPWFEQDFQGSLRVRQLDRAARWIYGDLLRAGWHCDTAPYFPNDEEQLRAICDCPRPLWNKHRESVMRCFTPTPDGKLLYHQKVVKEFNRALSEHQRKVAAGKSRWGKPIEGAGPQVHAHEHQELHIHNYAPQKASDDE